MPPRLRLPPLPDPREWSRHFPKAKLRISPDPINQRDFPGRSLLANRVLNDEFVRALKLRPNEVVIEAFAGPGALTRSLIAGGNQEDTAQLAADWVEKRAPSDGTTPVKVGKRRKPKPKLLVVRSDAQADDTKFPTWVDDLRTHKSATSSAETSALPRPRLVVCSEPSPEFLIRGLGMSSNDVPEPLGYIISRRKSTDSAKYPLTVTPSVYEDNLVLSPGSLYIWSTVPDILDHELVAPHVEALDGSAKRDWRAPPPPITLVGQIPDSLMGEQILSQWVSSVIGASYGGPNWLWEYGRARLAFLMAKNRYDRITARAGEAARGRLGVMAQALYHLTPLPPFHHVPNIDKRSTIEFARPVTKLGLNTTAYRALMAEAQKEAEGLPRTPIYPGDFWPDRTAMSSNSPRDQAYSRPPFLGLLFEPREDTLLRPEEKHFWDYVLRTCFMREAVPIREAMKLLGFGAENLLPRITDPGAEFRGKAVDPEHTARDLDIEQWLRIVDVFAKWAFRPLNLINDSLPLTKLPRGMPVT